MQLTGTQFTSTSALVGNDLSTLPDFPAEIRAPAGTLPGVSGLPGPHRRLRHPHAGRRARRAGGDEPGGAQDQPQGPQAATASSSSTPTSSTSATSRRPATRPIRSRTAASRGYRVFPVALTTMTRRALEGSGLDTKAADRCKNMFALGMCYWLFSRPAGQHRVTGCRGQVRQEARAWPRPTSSVLKAGWNFCDITELFHERYEVPAAALEPGLYRNITGNVAAGPGPGRGQPAQRPAALPRRLPDHAGVGRAARAVDLQELRRHHLPGRGRDRRGLRRHRRVLRRRARRHGLVGPGHRAQGRGDGLGGDDRAAAASCATSSAADRRPACPPRPSRRTCCRRSSAATASRRCRSWRRRPPKDCFDIALEAARLALKYMTPVTVLSDGYIANGSEPWKLPRVEDLPDLRIEFRTNPEGFHPYLRDPETLARPWAIPGTPGLEHRIGGLEKEDVTGNVSYDPMNHEQHGPPARREGGAHRQRHPAGRGGRRPRKATCWCWAGARPPAPSPAPSSAARRRGLQGQPRPPAPLESVPGQPRRGAVALRARCSCPR